MPLVPITLENAIKSKLELEFKKPAIKTELQKQLDGGPLAGKLSSAKNITKALGNIEETGKALSMGISTDPSSQAASKQIIKKTTANEWSSGIAEAVCEWMSKDVSAIIAKIIAQEVTTYIKTATIIIPPGQVVATAGSPAAQTGATTAPSPPAQIS
jgi:hypothetical protein